MRGSVPERRRPAADFASDFARASARLEDAVHDLIASGWDEPKRRQAHELASALAEAAKASGWKELGGILQAVASLLAMPLGDVIAHRAAHREKLLELLALLKDSPASESA